MKLVYYLILFTPLIPKLKVWENIYVYPAELALIVYWVRMMYIGRVPAFIAKSQITRLLLYYWALLFFFTIVNWPLYPILTDLFRVIKGFVYVLVIYIGYKYERHLLRDMLFWGGFGISIYSFYYFFATYRSYGFDIWRDEALFSGFSNRYIDISNLTINHIYKGAHAIYGDYLVLLMAITLFLVIRKQLSQLTGVLIIIFLVIGVLLTVSRTSLLTLVLFWALIALRAFLVKNFRLRMMIISIMVTFSLLLLVALIVSPLVVNLPLIQKVQYTIAAFSYSGTEMNISLRLGAWLSVVYGVIENPYRLLLGCGFNFACIKDYMQKAAMKYQIATMNPIPESLLVMSFQFGGLLGLIIIILFFFYTYRLTLRNNNPYFFIFGCYLLALLPGNIFSGASLWADLLYGQFLLIVGFLHSNTSQ